MGKAAVMPPTYITKNDVGLLLNQIFLKNVKRTNRKIKREATIKKAVFSLINVHGAACRQWTPASYLHDKNQK